MTVIMFLVNNTPSMLQQSIPNGVRHSYIDVAKRMADTFLKHRKSHEDRKYDRYMLLTYDTPPNHVKVGWKESMAQFNNALRNLQCTGSTPENAALGNAFDLLNQERMRVGIDSYGWGRCPVNTMHSFIILITNNQHMSTVNERLLVPHSSICTGSLLTAEPFRWDQRLFALVLGSSRCSPFLAQMCNKTGGWCTAIKCKYMLIYAMKNLLDSLKLELMVKFVHETEKRSEIGEITVIILKTTKCAIAGFTKTTKGWWPIPESYWPQEDQTKLEPRVAHPEVRIMSTCCDEPVWNVDVPIDRYVLREWKQTNATLPVTDCGKVWPVEIISSSEKKEQPFGYLKKEAGKICLYVLPYDYPELRRVIAENCTDLSINNKQFLYSMTHYINSIPRYYCFYLRKALTGILQESVLQTVLPPAQITYMNKTISNQLNQMQATAKQRRTDLFSYLATQQIRSASVAKQTETVERLHLRQLLEEEKDPILKENFLRPVVLPTTTERSMPDYRNLYSINRSDLLDTLNRMRNAFYYPATISALQRNQPSPTVPQHSEPPLPTTRDRDELVAEIAQYQREHPEKRLPTRRKFNSVQKKGFKPKRLYFGAI
uniref:VWFA domain-containing protein n=1 Tax=Anopheles maculatus TaxID=74869 RepID=A0A182SNW7_9DIPT